MSGSGAEYVESPENEPRRGGIEVSPGREPWVDAHIEPSPVGTAQRARGDLRIVLAESERDIALSDFFARATESASLTLAVAPKAAGQTTSCRTFATSQWIAARWAKPSFAPKPPPSPRWPCASGSVAVRRQHSALTINCPRHFKRCHLSAGGSEFSRQSRRTPTLPTHSAASFVILRR